MKKLVGFAEEEEKVSALTEVSLSVLCYLRLHLPSLLSP